jgi:hypothetical protein
MLNDEPVSLGAETMSNEVTVGDVGKFPDNGTCGSILTDISISTVAPAALFPAITDSGDASTSSPPN